MLRFVRANRQRDWRRLQAIDRESYPLDYWEWEDFMQEGLIIYQAIHRGSVIGWVGFWLNMKFPAEKSKQWRHKGCLYIGGISIRPKFLALGLFKEVMAFVLEYAEKFGMTEVSTNERESHEILPFLKECGFYSVATTTDYWENPPEPNVVLQLDL